MRINTPLFFNFCVNVFLQVPKIKTSFTLLKKIDIQLSLYSVASLNVMWYMASSVSFHGLYSFII